MCTVEAFADAFVHHADVADGFAIGICVAGGLRFVVVGPGAESLEGGGVCAGEEWPDGGVEGRLKSTMMVC